MSLQVQPTNWRTLGTTTFPSSDLSRRKTRKHVTGTSSKFCVGLVEEVGKRGDGLKMGRRFSWKWLLVEG